MRRPAALGPLLGALVIAGCGGEEEQASTSATPPAPQERSPAEEARPPSPPPPATTRPAPQSETREPGRPPRGEDRPGGGTDADALVPAAFDLGSDGSLTPRTISVPEFLGIRLEVSSTDDQAHRVELGTDPPLRLTVPPRGSVSRDVMGRRAGRFAVKVDGERAGTLVVGARPGP